MYVCMYACMYACTFVRLFHVKYQMRREITILTMANVLGQAHEY